MTMRLIEISIGFFLLLTIVFAQELIAADNPDTREPSLHQRVYHFQHRLLPKLTHEFQGAFFEILQKGEYERLRVAASRTVNEEFAKAISIRIVDSSNVLFIFPPPNETPECFFAYITKAKDGYRYLTLEKTLDIFPDAKIKGVVGEWTANGTHRTHYNLGPRNYDDVESFLSEMKKINESR